jgi:NADH:ubiquinone oxidoreductase subunit 4 (subunit M)
MIGVFVSLDLLLFYLFFEASLVPMFFLIGSGAANDAFTRRSSSSSTRPWAAC